jgi:hypothetical protein
MPMACDPQSGVKPPHSRPLIVPKRNGDVEQQEPTNPATQEPD